MNDHWRCFRYIFLNELRILYIHFGKHPPSLKTLLGTENWKGNFCPDLQRLADQSEALKPKVLDSTSPLRRLPSPIVCGDRVRIMMFWNSGSCGIYSARVIWGACQQLSEVLLEGRIHALDWLIGWRGWGFTSTHHRQHPIFQVCVPTLGGWLCHAPYWLGGPSFVSLAATLGESLWFRWPWPTCPGAALKAKMSVNTWWAENVEEGGGLGQNGCSVGWVRRIHGAETQESIPENQTDRERGRVSRCRHTDGYTFRAGRMQEPPLPPAYLQPSVRWGPLCWAAGSAPLSDTENPAPLTWCSPWDGAKPAALDHGKLRCGLPWWLRW